MDLSMRNTETELMDDPAVGTEDLMEVFRDINRSNRMLGGNHITVKGVEDLVSAHPRESYTIVDMGCGDGAILREVALRCRKQGIKARLIGVDLSEKAIGIAENACAGFPEICFLRKDILDMKTTDLDCDILLCTLTMHHFTDAQIPIFLEKFTKLASIGVVINDLHRSYLACYLFKAFRLIFIKTKIAKYDGLLSIQSGFTKKELVGFSRELPNLRHTIRWKWAFRYVWVIETARLSAVYE